MNGKTLLAILAFTLAGCGGGSDATKAQVRLVNASPDYAQLEWRVQDQVRQGPVAYGAAEAYVEVDPGKADSTVGSVGSATALLSFTPALSEKKHYTLLAFGSAGALRQMRLDENVGAPEAGRALLRVINAAADAGALDIYLTAQGDLLSGAVAAQNGVGYGNVGSFTALNSGTWQLRVTAAGSKTDLRLDVPSLAFGSKQVSTLVLTPTVGGIMVNALMLVQQGSITRLDTQHARVRLAAGVADSGVVGAAVGTTSLVSANTGGAVIASPSLDDYVLVPMGVSAVTATVNGNPLALPAQTLLAGGDYTFMVHGPAASPLASWIDDDNHLPSDASRAKLRLVSGVADSAAPLAMTLDGRPVAGAVALGQASPYSLVSPIAPGGTNGILSITATGLSTPVLTTPSQTFAAGSSYSVFLLGPLTSPTAIVRQDR